MDSNYTVGKVYWPLVLQSAGSTVAKGVVQCSMFGSVCGINSVAKSFHRL